MKKKKKEMKKCIKCGATKNLWYEPMVLLGFGKEEDYILCRNCLDIEYDDEI